MTALTLYVDSSGASTNSGSTTGTSPLANGTAATRAAAVYTLDGTPDLSGVTINQDTIHIVGETSGRGSNGTIFEITAVDDVLDTVTVSPTPTGGTTGLTWAIGGAVNTVTTGLQLVDAGDTLYIKAQSGYTEAPNVTTAGTNVANIIVEGYTTTPGDDGLATITASGTVALGSSLGSNIYYVFKNLIFTGSSDIGVYLNVEKQITFVNCQANNNANAGFYVDDYVNFINCEANNNGDRGIWGGISVNCYGCSFQGNSDYAVYASPLNVLYRCLFNNNRPTGTTLSSNGVNGDGFNMLGCTLDGDNATGQGALTGGKHFIFDTIFHDFGSDAIRGSSSYDGAQAWADYCVFSVIDGSNIQHGTPGGQLAYSIDLDVTGDPIGFTDEAGDDYTLSEASPAIGAGIVPGGIT
jgi:hypothetical protein